MMSVTPNRKRDAQEMAATMDHSDIRGLVTAFHLLLAGLPRSRSWDHRRDAHAWQRGWEDVWDQLVRQLRLNIKLNTATRRIRRFPSP